MAKLSPRARSIKAASTMAFGPRGLTRLAELAGVSKQLLSFIVGGVKPVSDDVYMKVAKALMRESERMRLASREVEEMADKMLRELEE
jgi:hypothetical protein